MKAFKDRFDAGRQLAEKLSPYRNLPKTVVLGLLRGGMPVAFEVARSIGAPLDVFVVRKVGAPDQPELAIGALAEDKRVVNEEILRRLEISERKFARAAAAEQRELRRLQQRYRKDKAGLELQGKTVILVDDGVATGASLRAAVMALRAFDPKKIVAAVPAVPSTIIAELREEIDDLVCVLTPGHVDSVGSYYQKFPKVSHREVQTLLQRCHETSPRT
ncbi:MAG: phosphoribosyltransferase [Desulfobacterales bacterium]|nr:phosphoribosyltransferase [Desulfobacterales bacterium]